MAEEQSVLPKASDLLGLAGRPAQVIEHPRWTTARETALARVAAGPCLIVLLGPPGSGKTTLLRNLATALRKRGLTVCLLDFDGSQAEVRHADVVLVDEADRLSAARIDELSRRGGRPVVLAALPASGERFRPYPDVAIVQLAVLSPDEACAFLAGRLAQLGLPIDCLTESAWAGLIAHARGVPRLLIALLGLALFVAGEDDARQVTGAHVEQAVAVRGGGAESEKVKPAPTRGDSAGLDIPQFLAADPFVGTRADRHSKTRTRRRTQAIAALMAVCLFAAAGALLTGGGHRETDRTESSGAGAPAAIETQRTASVASRTELPSPHGQAPAVAGTELLGPNASVVAGGPNPPRPAVAAAQGGAAPAPSAAPPPPASSPPTAAEQGVAAAPPIVAPQPAPAAASDTAQVLPSGPLIHVILIYPRGHQAAAQRGLDLARELRSDGFAVGEPFPVPPRESKPGISYYFAQDEDAAAKIGRRLGDQYGEGRLVRLPPSAGLPRPGTIEIALGPG